MNDWCGHCSHHRDAHRHWGACDEPIPCAGVDWPCRCTGFASIGSLLVRRVAVAVACCFLLFGSLPALVDLIVGGPR